MVDVTLALLCLWNFAIIPSHSWSNNSSQVCQYPNICGNLKNHIMCKPVPKTCYESKNIHRISMYLKHFNAFRNSFGDRLSVPKGFKTASDMNEIVWSTELQIFARRSTRMCKHGYDAGDDCRDQIQGPVAQLTYSKIVPKIERLPGLLEIFTLWTADIQTIHPNSVLSYSPQEDAIASVIIFSKLRTIGCGDAVFQFNRTHLVKNVVCNLYPAGPMPMQPIYTYGEKCLGCPKSMNCGNNSKYINLCSTKQHEIHRASKGGCVPHLRAVHHSLVTVTLLLHVIIQSIKTLF